LIEHPHGINQQLATTMKVSVSEVENIKKRIRRLLK
jgi:hypothetical protein